MLQHLGRIVIDPIGSSLLELLFAITAREHTDTESVCPPGGEQIPNTVAHHDGFSDFYA
jgi:hypothetical protein